MRLKLNLQTSLLYVFFLFLIVVVTAMISLFHSLTSVMICLSFLHRCTGNDLKCIIRLIKHDLKMNAGAKHV